MRDLEFNYLIMNEYDCLTVLINIYIYLIIQLNSRNRS